MSTGYIHAQRIKKLKLQGKTATSNGLVTPDEGYDGFSQVTVNVPSEGGGEQVEGFTIFRRRTTIFQRHLRTKMLRHFKALAYW